MQDSPRRKIIDLKIIDSRIGDTFEMPDYQTTGSAGIDLLACIEEPLTIEPGQTELIPSGIAAADHFKVTQLLLEAGADPNIKDEYGDTALSEAQIRNKDDTVDLLIRNGAKAE